MSNFKISDTDDTVMENYVNIIETGGLYTKGTNVIGGRNAMPALTVGSADNVGVGVGVGLLITTGSRNIALGTDALATVTTGEDNVAIGDNALTSLNAAISDNTVIGSNAGAALTTGTNNVIMGTSAADAATTSDQCVIIGSNAVGTGVMTGNDNVIIGFGAGLAATSGASSLLIGSNAGDTITTGSNNICIGHNADVDAAAADTRMAIGYGTTATADNTYVIGNTTNYTAGGYAVGLHNEVRNLSGSETLTAATSNTIYTLDADGGVINLPAISADPGSSYTFTVDTTLTTAWIIAVAALSGENITGFAIENGAVLDIPVTTSSIQLDIGAAVGSSVKVVNDGVTWIAVAHTSGAFITLA